MKPVIGRSERIPCAIYTRKSSEEGLEQGFNSLDAQREACAAYILSQKGLGWVPVNQTYDDGGYSGGNVDRPGLTQLLSDIDAQRIKVVVVYKVDRLTRSLADFAKMVERFDAHGVSFVSVTQQFNTTTSMGRLTLNVLLSFAQFEREVTGERIRDKIAASKRKGMWMGGLAPIGYVPNERTLAIDEANAQRVREIYRLYLEENCVRKLKDEVDRRNWITPPRQTKRLGAQGERPFSRGHLYRILSNPVYIGQIAHKAETFSGNHPPIIDPELWAAVQVKLAENRQGHRLRKNAKHSSLLAGLLIDDHGQRLTPAHTRKHNKRYRYYVVQSSGAHGTPGPDGNPRRLHIPAHDLERAVVDGLVGRLADESWLLSLADAGPTQAFRDLRHRAKSLADQLQAASKGVIESCIRQVTVGQHELQIAFRLAALGLVDDKEATVQIDLPVELKRRGRAMRLILEGGLRRVPDARMILLLSKAQEWFARLTSGHSNSVASISRTEGIGGSWVGRVIHLAVLAPDIVQDIVRGEHPPSLNADRLIRMVPLPMDWAQQRSRLGFGSPRATDTTAGTSRRP